MKLFRTLTAAGFVAAAAIAPAVAVDISGAGATFPYPVYAKWADAYKKETGAGLNYQSIGSGRRDQAGPGQDRDLRRFRHAAEGGRTPEGGPRPIPDRARRRRAGDQYRGHQAGDITLDGPTLAKIFMGEIKTWDDPAIAKLNPSAKLPAQAIVVVHRSDGSGTTFIWTDYLSKVSADWKSKVGANTVGRVAGRHRRQGQRGRGQQRGQTKGSIGYVEYAYAKQNKLTFAKLINKDGKTVAPTSKSFQAAAATADWVGRPRLLASS